MRLTLLLLTSGEQRVQILQTHLLLRLTKARELLSKARDPLSETCRLLLCTETCLNAGESKLRGLKSEVPGQLRSLHAQRTCCLRCLLRSLRCRFKTACPKLRCAARLLLENIALKLLLCNRLARSAEGALTDCLCAEALTSDLTLTRNVGHRLLDHGLLKRVHVRHGRARSQPRYTCTRCADAKVCRPPQGLLSGGHLAGDAAGKAHCSHPSLLQCPNTCLRQTGGLVQKRLERTYATARKLERLLLIWRELSDKLRRELNPLLHQSVGKVRDPGLVLTRGAY